MTDISNVTLQDDPGIDPSFAHWISPDRLSGIDLHPISTSVATCRDQHSNAVDRRYDRSRIGRIKRPLTRCADPDAFSRAFVEGIIAMPEHKEDGGSIGDDADNYEVSVDDR